MPNSPQPPQHPPMRRLRIQLLSSHIAEGDYEETINVKPVSSGVVNDNEFVVKRVAAAEALALLEQSDPDNELYAELVISPLPPEKRGYKKASEGAALQQILEAKLKG